MDNINDEDVGTLPEECFSHEFIVEAYHNSFGSSIQIGRSCVDGKECHLRLKDDKNS